MELNNSEQAQIFTEVETFSAHADVSLPHLKHVEQI